MKWLFVLFLLLLVGCVPNAFVRTDKPLIAFGRPDNALLSNRGIALDFNVDTITENSDFPLNLYLTNYRGRNMDVDLNIYDGWDDDYSNVDYKTSIFLEDDEYLADQQEPDVTQLFRYYGLGGKTTTITLVANYNDEVNEEVQICIVKTVTKGRYDCLVDEVITGFDDGSKASYGITSVTKKLIPSGGNKIRAVLTILIENKDVGAIDDNLLRDFYVNSNLAKFNCNLEGDISLKQLGIINNNPKLKGIVCNAVYDLGSSEFMNDNIRIGYKYDYSVIVSKNFGINEDYSGVR